VHISNSHWLCCILNVEDKNLLVIDSYPGFNPLEVTNKIGKYCHNWYRDELKATKKSIAEFGGPCHIDNPVIRQAAIQDLSIKLSTISDWQIIPTTLWQQNNSENCGIYTP
jgi:Ulp1 family protease